MANRKVVLAITLLISLLIILEMSHGVKRIHSFAGPYRILGRTTPNMTSQYNSTNKLTVKMMFTSPSIKTTQYVWGQSYLSETVDDTFDVDVLISQWSNNQWKPNAFVMKFRGACSSAMRHAKSIVPYLVGINLQKCPIPAGYRESQNQTFYPVFPQFPTFPYGRWLFNLIIHKRKTVYGVLSIDGEAVPKL